MQKKNYIHLPLTGLEHAIAWLSVKRAVNNLPIILIASVEEDVLFGVYYSWFVNFSVFKMFSIAMLKKFHDKPKSYVFAMIRRACLLTCLRTSCCSRLMSIKQYVVSNNWFVIEMSKSAFWLMNGKNVQIGLLLFCLFQCEYLVNSCFIRLNTH